MSGVRLQLLGTVAVFADDGAVDLGGLRPVRVLLALYAAENHSLSLEALAEHCFDDNDRPDDPVPALRTAVRRVRRALGDDAVKTRSGGYQLDLSGVDVDVDRFENRIRAGRAAADPVSAVSCYRQALDIWNGEPFGHYGDREWLDLERFRLEEAYLGALEGWHDAHLRNGTATEILPTLESVAMAHPLRERFHRQLMRALFLADRQADALRAFQVHREALAEAGLEPSDETLDLEQRIVISDDSLRVADQGRRLRGYQILERLGEGAFSVVYRGTQPSVERDVAIKQIRSELANRPEFIRRFEAEAHMVARLEHPYIVPLYDYWREPGSAYLVMRMLRGGNLESAILDGRLSIEQVRKVVQQVGAALSVAHRAGVVHRDVKPANILLDDDGNAYLSDFGIALDDWDRLDPEAALSAGSPAYASPEQLRRQPVGPEADVHGLGIAVFEALTGRLPFPDEPDQASLLQRQLHDPIPAARNARAELPADVDAVLQRATAKQAKDRYPSIEAFIDAFEAAFDHGPVQAPVRGNSTRLETEERNPFKGLRAFTEADALDFAGRARLVDQLVASVREHRLTAVVGPSGSGKSSVVRAGLLPALRDGSVLDSDQWFVATMVPGSHPHEELEAALVRISAEPVAGLLDVLQDGERGLSRALRQSLPEGGQLLLVIDQFEELFTLVTDEAPRRQFLDTLATAVSEERSRLRVVFTLRADFYDRPLRYESVGRLVRDATIPVLPLAADELERAIIEPARSVGCQLEPGLVSEIVADVSDQPGALPMLQYALTELYERRVSGMLTRSAYRELGGVTGALASRADELFDEAPPSEQDDIRRLFGRLVTFGEGAEDTRRRVRRSEIGDGVADELIAKFGDARLLSFDRDPLSREPTVEVAHEALIREWPRLRAWVDEDRDGLRVHRHLTDTARAWEASGRDQGELYRSGRLEAAESWAGDNPSDLNTDEQAFLNASVARRSEEHEAETRTNRRLRRLLAGVGVVALIALLAGAVAFQQQGRAEENAEVAESARAASETLRIGWEGVSRAATDRQLGLLLAATAHERDPGAETLGFLQRTLATTDGFLGFFGTDRSYLEGGWLADGRLVAVHLDGVDILSTDLRERIEVDVQVHSGLTLGSIDGTRLSVTPLAIADALGLVAIVNESAQILLIDTDDGTVQQTIAAAGEIDRLAFSPAGERIAAINSAGDLSLWDVPSGDLVASVTAHPESFGREFEYPEDLGGPEFIPVLLGEMPVQEFPANVVFLDDGSLVTARVHTFKRWGGQDLQQIGDSMFVRDPQNNPWGFFPISGFRIDRGPTEGSVRVINHSGQGVLDATSGGTLGTFRVSGVAGIANAPRIVAMEPIDEDRHIAAISNGELRMIAADGSDTVAPRFTGLSSIASGVVDADRDRVAVLGPEGGVLYSIGGNQLIATGLPRDGRDGASITSSGDRVSVLDHSGQRDDPSVVWDLRVASPTPIMKPGENEVGPNGRPWFWFINETGWRDPKQNDGAIDLYDAESFELLGAGIPTTGRWSGHVASTDQSLVAIGRSDAVLVWDIAQGEQLALLDVGVSAGSLTFDPSADRLAIAHDNVVTVWSMDTLERVGEFEGSGVRFSPGGTYLAVWLEDGTIQLRDPASFEELVRLDGPVGLGAEQTPGVFSYDDQYLLAVTEGALRLWDLEELEQIGDPFPNDRGFRPAGSDGLVPRAVTGVGEHVLVWNLEVSSWRDIACQAAGRNLTLDEWEQFGPTGEPYRATCSQWPPAAGK